MDQFLSWEVNMTQFSLGLIKDLKQVSQDEIFKMMPKSFPDTSKINELIKRMKELKNAEDFRKFTSSHPNSLGLLLFHINLPRWNRDINKMVEMAQLNSL
jgi:hypothetical protein